MMELFILYVNFFFPVFTKWTNSSSGSILLNLLLIILSSLIIFINKKEVNFNQVIIKINIFYVAMILISLFTNLDSFIFRDLYEFQRPVLYAEAFLLGNIYVKKRKMEIKKIYKDLNKIFNIFLIINLLKIFDSKNIFFSLYQREGLATHYRLSGTFISPYDYAYFLIFPLIFFLETYMKTKKKIYLLKFILVLISILMTQSRSQFITLVFSFVIYFVLKIKFIFLKQEKRFFYKNIILFLLSLVVTYNIFADKLKSKLQYLYIGLSNIFKYGFKGDGSSRLRYEQTIMALETFKFLGNGTGKGKKLLFENQYALYLFRYGLLGIIYNIFLILYLFLISYVLLKKIKKVKNIYLSILVMSFGVFIFSLPIALLPNNTIDQIRISFFFYFLIGIFCEILKSLKKLTINKI